MVFLGVLFLTLACLAVLFWLAIYGSHATTDAQIPIAEKNLTSACNFGWQAGLGAIFGLLGGKAID
jgi:hypothetical protein